MLNLYSFLENHPTCSNNMSRVSREGDIIEYSCQVGYRGDLPPAMKWLHEGSMVSNAHIVDGSVPGKLVKSSMFVKATLDRIGDIYTCHTFFNTPDLDAKDIAKNAPAYSHTYEAQTLIIKRKLYIFMWLNV